ncbi:Trans-aconitate 3-methyltransferase [Ophiocordyceps camponoti-floridani]|uniref:Trans-aconitate 3-methyltransferase n=1 Tax=Ophiocordyceps camponoti-floridani TaxID=2030778 RepID=A0A8H4QBG4_9HYPO|nr:Trans-aconitate 3-methyltransferase [Ophiocordyceps camponoti-floridani]
MSVFGRATFSAAGYAAARPSYPDSLYQTVLAYVEGPRDLAVDLGCGHGVVTREISRHFGRVIGLDKSAGMVQQASSTTALTNVSFRQAGAESLPFLADGSVDVVVAGQSAHWFDYDRAWPELARVVRPGGLLAFWGYKDNVFVGRPAASKVLDRFCYGAGEVGPGIEGLRRYWEQPGRDLLRGLLRTVKPPADSWDELRRIEHDVEGDEGAASTWLRMKMRLGDMEAYIKTFSSVQGWRDAHQGLRGRDIADVLMKGIVEAEEDWRALGEGWREAETEVAWGTYVLLARRREDAVHYCTLQYIHKYDGRMGM